jgi:hypothetical protein
VQRVEKEKEDRMKKNEKLAQLLDSDSSFWECSSTNGVLMSKPRYMYWISWCKNCSILFISEHLFARKVRMNWIRDITCASQRLSRSLALYTLAHTFLQYTHP